MWSDHSHSGKGNGYDNAACETFFSHLKSESLRPFPPKDKGTLISQIREYINWYNYHRSQEKLKGMTLWNSGSHTLLNNTLFILSILDGA
ncbi:IS3 family transposase [Streptococcus mutans]|uniref:IS3 family transposase n=1 Tax=Streptococcus mutans TaxID=1309 RepID=UPI001CFEE82D|nr:IS3 family transposase [Streptococcus mutans]MCB4973425.1 IS3 family transposase [Streptococcus mutans]